MHGSNYVAAELISRGTPCRSQRGGREKGSAARTAYRFQSWAMADSSPLVCTLDASVEYRQVEVTKAAVARFGQLRWVRWVGCRLGSTRQCCWRFRG